MYPEFAATINRSYKAFQTRSRNARGGRPSPSRFPGAVSQLIRFREAWTSSSLRVLFLGLPRANPFAHACPSQKRHPATVRPCMNVNGIDRSDLAGDQDSPSTYVVKVRVHATRERTHKNSQPRSADRRFHCVSGLSRSKKTTARNTTKPLDASIPVSVNETRRSTGREGQQRRGVGIAFPLSYRWMRDGRS